MSNLGTYQWITTASKAVGGPKKLLVLTGVIGVAIYKSGELCVKKGIKTIKKRLSSIKHLENVEQVYSVTSFGESNEGVIFPTGSQYSVLEIDGDSVLIEKIGDNNNPYFVSAEFLSSISNFKNE